MRQNQLINNFAETKVSRLAGALAEAADTRQQSSPSSLLVSSLELSDTQSL